LTTEVDFIQTRLNAMKNQQEMHQLEEKKIAYIGR
jgi:hypothetical protein